MKKIIWIIISVVLVGLVMFKLTSNKKEGESKIYHYDKEKPIAVEVETIALTSLNDDAAFTGTFEPNKEVKVSAETQGKINVISVDVGSYVQQGQTIIQLDNSLLKLQLQSVDVQIEGLEDDINRYTILAEADAIQGVQLEKVKLGLKSALVQKATLQEQINKTTIKAPFSGIVTAKLTEIGAFAAPGMPLLQITDIHSLRFTVNVPESNLEYFKEDKDYLVSVDVMPETPLNGRLSLIGSKANMGNSFPIQFLVENTQNLDVKSGMFGKVALKSSSTEEGILIPSSAIINEGGKTKVYLVKEGKAVLQSISTSKTIGNKTLISQGLVEGDVIIIKGFINLFDKANVSIS